MSIKTSVCITTYNHENFIAQALNSVLMQKVDFEYEIIIGEDDSTDDTRNIVKEYKKRYPDRIRLFLNDRKDVIFIGGKPTGRRNFINNLKFAQGEYIAILDGDDFWTDSLKLKKQVDFLDSHSDFAICFHWAGWLEQDSGEMKSWKYGPPFIKEYYNVEDLLAHSNFIPTCSAMFRNRLFSELPDWFRETPIGDFPLYIIIAQHGKIGFIDECMAVYRRHMMGLHGGRTKTENLERLLHTYADIGSHLGLKKRPSFCKGVGKHNLDLFKSCLKDKKMFKAFHAAIKAFIWNMHYQSNNFLKNST